MLRPFFICGFYSNPKHQIYSKPSTLYEHQNHMQLEKKFKFSLISRQLTSNPNETTDISI